MKKFLGLALGVLLFTTVAYAKPLLKTPRTTVPTIQKIDINKDRLVVIKGDIEPELAGPVVKQITDLDLENHQPIFLIINTPGGSVVDGFEIISAMQAAKSPITCIVESEAYSMGALMLSYCKTAYIHKFGNVMFHEASYKVQGSETMIQTRVAATQKYLDQQFTDVAAQLGLTLAQFRAKIKNEWWMTAAETVKSGLADAMILELQYPYDPPEKGFSLDFGSKKKFQPGRLDVVLKVRAKEPKFHMGDKVRVTKGFYSGCVHGTVVDIIPAGNTISGKDEYMIEDFVCRGGKTKQIAVLSEDVLALEFETK